MFFLLERVTEPDIEPVDLLTMKRHLRAFDDIDTDDEAIQELITGARQWVERETGRALIDQQWRLTLTDTASALWPLSGLCGVVNVTTEISLRRSPVLSVESFVSVASDGTETAIAASSYEVRGGDSKYPKLVALGGASFAAGTYRIVFRAGYADRATSPVQAGEVVPVTLKQAMKLWAEAQYTRDPKTMPLLMETASALLAGENCNVGLA